MEVYGVAVAEILGVLRDADGHSLTARQIKRKANGLCHNGSVDASDYSNPLRVLNEEGLIEHAGSTGPRNRWRITEG